MVRVIQILSLDKDKDPSLKILQNLENVWKGIIEPKTTAATAVTKSATIRIENLESHVNSTLIQIQTIGFIT